MVEAFWKTSILLLLLKITHVTILHVTLGLEVVQILIDLGIECFEFSGIFSLLSYYLLRRKKRR